MIITVILLLLQLLDKTSQQPLKTLDLCEGDICREKGNMDTDNHVCVDAKKCKTLSSNIKKQMYPDICSFVRNDPIICCPPATKEIDIPNIVIEKCKEAAQLAKKYPKGSSKSKLAQALMGHMFVVGGTDAESMEFPHMALLGSRTADDDEIMWGCGGSLISERWILTAAHCREIGYKKEANWARVGELNIISRTDNARPKDYQIVQRVIHPDYISTSRYNDIGLFRLETEVEFSEYVRPICLNSDPYLDLKSSFIATGWGKTATGESTSDSLKKVDLNMIPVDQCNKSYTAIRDPKLKLGIQSDSMICAGSSDGTKDTCGGDSGGPLQIINDGLIITYTQVGVTSFGVFCGDKNLPGVYTRVSNYIPWIQNVVWS